MNLVLDDFRRIARVTTVQRDARSGKAMAWLGGLMVLGLAIGVMVAAGKGKLDAVLLARAMVGLAGFWLSLVWGIVFIPGSVLIHSAANARLLPRQRRRLMQMAGIGWLLCTLSLAIAIDSWGALPIAGFYLIGLPLSLAGYRQMFPVVILACNWPVLSRNLLPKAPTELLASGPSLAVLTVLLLPAGALALRLLYPAGGDAWIARRAGQIKRIQRIASGEGADFTETAPGGKRLQRLYAIVLRRDCRRRDPSSLLMHVLGPAAHWSAWLGAGIVFLLIAGGVHVLMLWKHGEQVHDTLTGAAAGFSGVMAIFVLFNTVVLGQQLRRTRGEQALLRLTPLAGDAALLNRRLAAGLAGRTLKLWLAQIAVVLAATWLLGGDDAALPRQFALCCLAGQVSLMGLLGDFAREAGWNWTLGLRAALVAAVEAAAAAGLGWLAGPSPWPWLILIALVGAGVQLRYGWRRMLAAPVAFPAGRLD